MALNSAVWRLEGVSERIFSTSSRKPRSSISSASSRTTKRQLVQHQRVSGDQIEHATDGAHDHMPAGPQLGLLGADRRASEDGHHVDSALVRRRCAAPG